MNSVQACVKIRKAGIRMGNTTFLYCMQQGAFPFATAIRTKKRWKYIINEQALDDWIQKNSGPIEAEQ